MAINLHENLLNAIEWSQPDKTAKVSLWSPWEKRPVVIELTGVEDLYVSHLRLYNMVEELTHWTKDAMEDEAGLLEAVTLMHSQTDVANCPDYLKPFIQALIDRVARGEVEVMDMTAIDGAYVAAVFKTMSIRFADPRSELE